jgi:hypothetical protein
MVGVEFPLKSQNYIHDFFQKNAGYEFIGYHLNGDFLSRIKYWHFGTKYARSSKVYQRILYRIEQLSVGFQKIIGVNRINGIEQRFKKGYANWSITHGLACYIIKEFEKEKKYYCFTLCADEIFIHTMVFNSDYYDKVYNKNDEYASAMRLTTWDDAQNQFHLSDYDRLMKSDKLFARKFDDANALELIKKIKDNRLDETLKY